MKRKSRYRKILILLLVINLTVLFVFTYFKLYNSIPNQLRIMVGENENFNLNLPFEASFSNENVGVLNINNKKVASNKIKLDLNKPFSLNSTSTGKYKVNIKLFGLTFKQIELGFIDSMEVMPCGQPIGIYIETEGVMVLGTGVINGQDGLNYEPALNKIKTGDYIIAVNNKVITNKEELIHAIQNSNGKDLKIKVRRESKDVEYVITPVKTADGDYKIGTWIRDDTQGIGTMTFITKDGKFGALGHGITDVDTSLIMQIHDGAIYTADIMTIVKGRKGAPGELIGLINQSEKYRLGNIIKNTNQGIFGTIKDSNKIINTKGYIKVGLKQDVKIGPATILCCVENQIKEYDIEIDKIDINSSSPNKGMVISITDPDLLNLTGGIVQGMSGSPIIQNNELIGAVTHVFIQDSTKGYGTFIENMIYNLEEN